MPIVSVTRLRIRSLRFLLQFLWMNSFVKRQIVKSYGFLRGRLLVDKGFTFWTTTAWSDEASMRAFRDSAAHKRAMPRLQNWCSEATSVHWSQDSDELPDWTRAYDRILKNGHVVYVKAPSEFHKERRFAAPNVGSKMQQELRPK
jgi:heme-degrading monooxygenase HmoA